MERDSKKNKREGLSFPLKIYFDLMVYIYVPARRGLKIIERASARSQKWDKTLGGLMSF